MSLAAHMRDCKDARERRFDPRLPTEAPRHPRPRKASAGNEEDYDSEEEKEEKEAIFSIATFSAATLRRSKRGPGAEAAHRAQLGANNAQTLRSPKRKTHPSRRDANGGVMSLAWRIIGPKS